MVLLFKYLPANFISNSNDYHSEKNDSYYFQRRFFDSLPKFRSDEILPCRRKRFCRPIQYTTPAPIFSTIIIRNIKKPIVVHFRRIFYRNKTYTTKNRWKDKCNE